MSEPQAADDFPCCGPCCDATEPDAPLLDAEKDADPFRQCRTSHVLSESLAEINDIAYGIRWLCRYETGDGYPPIDFQSGDGLILRDEDGTVRLMARIIHVHRGGFMKKGYVLLSLADICQARAAEPTE
jgi:hypothetical protein